MVIHWLNVPMFRFFFSHSRILFMYSVLFLRVQNQNQAFNSFIVTCVVDVVVVVIALWSSDVYAFFSCRLAEIFSRRQVGSEVYIDVARIQCIKLNKLVTKQIFVKHIPFIALLFNAVQKNTTIRSRTGRIYENEKRYGKKTMTMTAIPTTITQHKVHKELNQFLLGILALVVCYRMKLQCYHQLENARHSTITTTTKNITEGERRISHKNRITVIFQCAFLAFYILQVAFNKDRAHLHERTLFSWTFCEHSLNMFFFLF